MLDGRKVSDLLKALVAAELKVPAATIADDSTLEDLGLDSLTLAECVIALEEEMKMQLDVTGLEDALTYTDTTTFAQLTVILAQRLHRPDRGVAET